ncbi:MAG TPA: DUF4912 domain-containing protein [Pyrinomonadaceae bacterium]|nr:DUF4912 domain-containing protein [Pyrinomonadaceae bacterium]
MRARAQKRKKVSGEAQEALPAQTQDARPPADVAAERPAPDPQEPPVVAPVLMPAVGLDVPVSELAVVAGALAAGGVAKASDDAGASGVAASQLSTAQHEDAASALRGEEPPSERKRDARPAAVSPAHEGQGLGDDAAEGAAWQPRDQARLLVQSPRRLFLYWRFARDPRELLREAIGPAAENFRPAVRLVDVASGEEGQPSPAEGGDYWFDVLPGRLLRADVGFYGEGLPFVRLLSSNTVETPAAGVSRAEDEAPEFRVAEQDFNRVLEATGFAAEERQAEPARGDAPGCPFDPARFGAPPRTDEPLRPRASSDTARPTSSPRNGGHFSNMRGELF